MTDHRKFGIFWLCVGLIATGVAAGEHHRGKKSFALGQDAGRCEMALVVIDSQPDLIRGHEATVEKCRKLVKDHP